MSTENKTKRGIYVLDANVLIGFALWRPISLCKPFWDGLAQSLSDGDCVLIDVVFGEIRYTFDKGFAQWCKEQKKSGVIREITDEDRERAISINNKFQMIDEKTQKSTVDTYIIAYAERNGLSVFSREGQRKMATDLYKIPDVCDELKVGRTRSPEVFLKRMGIN